MTTVVSVIVPDSDPSDSFLNSLVACFIACRVSVMVSDGVTLFGLYLSGRLAFNALSTAQECRIDFGLGPDLEPGSPDRR